MDPITLSTAFATMVGLVSDFNASRQGTAAASVEDFKAWLAENRHQDVIRALDQNAATLLSVKILLLEDRKSLGEQLRSLDEQLARLASGLELFKPLASAVHPGLELSAQAMGILQRLYAAGAGKFLKSGSLSGTDLMMIDGSGGGSIPIDEPQFLESDIDTLLQLRLITYIGRNGRGDPMYAFSRNAAALVKARDFSG